MGQEREEKILVPNSILTLFEQENSEKYSKKIPKLKKPFSSNIFSQNEMRSAEKVKKKNFSPEFCTYPTQPRKLEKKNRKKIQKI